MGNVLSRSCFHASCTRRASFNFEDNKTAAYCKQHAKEGMVNALTKRCSQAFCLTPATCNVEGSKVVANCKHHAPEEMVCVHGRRCSHDACTRHRVQSIVADGTATVCARHGNDLLRSPVINFKVDCKVPGCRKGSSWGIHGQQPTHCRDHGPLTEGLAQILGMQDSKCSLASSLPSLESPPHHIETECFF